MRRFRVPEQLRPWLSHLGYALVAIGASAPAWIVKYPPIQDLAYHAATVRVLHSFHDPAFGLDRYFDLHLSNTHYLLYYLAGALLSYPLTVAYANVLLIAVYFAGSVLAMRSLLTSLGRDGRISLLCIPILSNVLLMYGLLPFLIGIPLMFWGMALAVRHCITPKWSTGIALGIVCLACFFSHIVPFGLLGLCCAVMLPWNKPKTWLRAAAPGIPAIGVVSWWMLATDAGKTTGGLLAMHEGAGRRTLSGAFSDVFSWFTNIFQDNTDEFWTIAWFAVLIIAMSAAAGQQTRAHPITARFGVVPLACLLFYFALPVGHDFIWPLAQRFVVLLVLTLIPLLPYPSGIRGHIVTAIALVVAAGTTINTSKHFITFQLEEVGDFDDAKAAISPGKKVCALMYDRGSAITNHQPFLHFGSWVQAQHGGVVMFTFAGYPHWPFDFKPNQAPPSGSPAPRRWEWTPEHVSSSQLFPYYDYVITRGKGFDAKPEQFQPVYEGSTWNVWKRVDNR